MCFYDMIVAFCFGNHIQVLQLVLRWKVMPEIWGSLQEDMEERVGIEEMRFYTDFMLCAVVN